MFWSRLVFLLILFTLSLSLLLSYHCYCYCCYYYYFNRFTKAYLDAKGIRVPFHRVRMSLGRVDGAAATLRLGNTVQRREYRVASPNSLWHFDGNHKLIK